MATSKFWVVAVSATLLASLFACTNTEAGEAPPSDRKYTLLPIVTEGLQRPLFLIESPDDSGRLFVLEQPGRIRIVRDGELVAEPFLDITSIVDDRANEQGLLGLAFSPGFTENGYFYVNYTREGGDTVIARFNVSADNPDRADPNSQQVVMGVDQPYPNHNGGMLAFGPDGYLYIGMGDGGSGGDPQGNGQNPFTRLGKLLRIDVSSPHRTLHDPAE
jgi:glucose/arabinose dehydrogenase